MPPRRISRTLAYVSQRFVQGRLVVDLRAHGGDDHDRAWQGKYIVGGKVNHMLVSDVYTESLLTRVELGLYPMLGGGLSSVEDSEHVGLDCGVGRDVPCELGQMV